MLYIEEHGHFYMLKYGWGFNLLRQASMGIKNNLQKCTLWEKKNTLKNPSLYYKYDLFSEES